MGAYGVCMSVGKLGVCMCVWFTHMGVYGVCMSVGKFGCVYVCMVYAYVCVWGLHVSE